MKRNPEQTITAKQHETLTISKEPWDDYRIVMNVGGAVSVHHFSTDEINKMVEFVQTMEFLHEKYKNSPRIKLRVTKDHDDTYWVHTNIDGIVSERSFLTTNEVFNFVQNIYQK